MLDTDQCSAYMDEVQAATQSCRLQEKFLACLTELKTHGCDPDGDLEEARCVLYQAAPTMSFTFKMESRDNHGIFRIWKMGALTYNPEKYDWEISYSA